MALDVKGYFANIPKRQLYILLGVFGAGVLRCYLRLRWRICCGSRTLIRL